MDMITLMSMVFFSAGAGDVSAVAFMWAESIISARLGLFPFQLWLVDVEDLGGGGLVVDDPGVDALVLHVAVVVSGDAEGGGEALVGVVVLVLFVVHVPVLD